MDGLEFQSTLLQEERHSPTCCHKFSVKISIHAPTRGATKATLCIPLMLSISIHAPTRGATFTTSKSKEGEEIFQSTLLQEERQHPHPVLQPHPYDFNPRSYKRSDVMFAGADKPISLFQSTLLQEERHNVNEVGDFEYLFQSTLLQEERRRIHQKI